MYESPEPFYATREFIPTNLTTKCPLTELVERLKKKFLIQSDIFETTLKAMRNWSGPCEAHRNSTGRNIFKKDINVPEGFNLILV